MPKADHMDRTRGYIEHMLRYCIQIEDTLNEIGYSRERFSSTHTHSVVPHSKNPRPLCTPLWLNRS